MKTIQFFIISILFFTASCSKDDAMPTTIPIGFQDEMPITTFYTNIFNDRITPTLSQPAQEYGITFKPIEYGVIKAFTIKLPVNPSRTRFTLWDKATGNKLLTQFIPLLFGASGANVEYVLILETPFALTKNKEYILSVNTTDWYFRENQATPAIYPYNYGSIQVTSYCFSAPGSAQVMPTNLFLGNHIFGDLGFKFQRI